MTSASEYWVAVDHSVIVDNEGHTVDGYTRVKLDRTDQVDRAVRNKQLVRIPEESNPDHGSGDTNGASPDGTGSDEKIADSNKASTKSSTKKEK